MFQENLKKEILTLLQDENFMCSVTSRLESPAKRYCHSINLLLNGENAKLSKQFILEYRLLLEGKSIPVFKVSTVILLYRKWMRYPLIFKEINYLATKIKEKNFDADFWNQFIVSTASDKAKAELQTARLNLLICLFNSKTLKKDESLKHGIVIDTILKMNIHQDDFESVKKQLKQENHPYHRMFFIIRRLIDLKVPGLELAEIIRIHFSTPDRSLNFSDSLKELYVILEEKLTYTYHLELKKMDIGKLNLIHQLSPKLFESLEVESGVELKLDQLLQNVFNGYMFSGVFIRGLCTDQISSTEMKWFIDELSGKNIVYSANLPCKITKKAAHYFRCLPYAFELSVTRSLIYSAIYVSILDDHFSLIVARSIRSLDRAEYWIETMTLLHKNGLRSVDVREVMDYLQEKVIIRGEQICLKNKSIRNLLLEIDHWHEELRVTRLLKRVGTKKLVESEIDEFFTDFYGQAYIIRQIKRTNELYYEGSYLHHCVYTYRKYCMDGTTFIFSLRSIDEKAEELPLITIEVVSNEVRQTKGKFNRLPTDLEKDIIRLWAQEKQLKYAC
jgi:hypothetical protein